MTEETIYIDMPDYTVSWMDLMDFTGQCWCVQTKHYFDGREEVSIKKSSLKINLGDFL